jgi:hypothetical protein
MIKCGTSSNRFESSMNRENLQSILVIQPGSIISTDYSREIHVLRRRYLRRPESR